MICIQENKMKTIQNLLELLKKRNRTVLEMFIGTVFYGLVIQAAGIFIAKSQPVFAMSLWLGIGLSLLATIHMYRTIDMALDFDEETAGKLMRRGYIIRYVVLYVVMAFLCFTEVLNPLVTFLGYMSLKGTVYLQPFTHKLCNKMFHETDEVFMAGPQEASPDGKESCPGDVKNISPDVMKDGGDENR